MPRPSAWRLSAVWLMAGSVSAGLIAQSSSASSQTAADGRVFGLTRLHQVTVAMSAAEWNVLQTSSARGSGVGGTDYVQADFAATSHGCTRRSGSTAPSSRTWGCATKAIPVFPRPRPPRRCAPTSRSSSTCSSTGPTRCSASSDPRVALTWSLRPTGRGLFHVLRSSLALICASAIRSIT